MQLQPEHAADLLPAAEAGLRTTRRRLRQHLEGIPADPGLCHGWSGLVDIVWTGADVLGRDDDKTWARNTCLSLLAKQDLPEERLLGPSLLLGHAGVGYTLLRLARPEAVPSILAVC